MQKIKGAIFDLDGTLLDSMGVWQEIDVKFLGKRGFEVPEDYLKTITPMGFARAADYTIARFGLSEKPEELIDEWYQMAKDAYGHEVGLKPHAKEYLEALKAKGVKIAAATSSAKELMEPCMRRNGIWEYFDAFVTTMEVPRGKDFPDVYLEAARRLGLEPGECAVYEDILKGIRAAKLAGCCFAVAMEEEASAHEAAELRAEADLYISDFKELLERETGYEKGADNSGK